MDTITLSTTKTPRRNRRSVRAVAIAAAVVPLIGVAALAGSAPPAAASPWDPHVALTGAIQCPARGGPFDKVSWAWVEGNGENSWAWLGSGGVRKPYRKDFYRIPSGRSVNVHVRYGCSASGAHDTWFNISRPSIGSYTTRNIG